MHTKYNILWFLVDMHHRERYFFICGCKRIVTKLWRDDPPEAAERTELAAF